MGTTQPYRLNREYFIFQQNNDPEHTSRLSRKTFSRNQIHFMERSPHSPDSYPIENFLFALQQALQSSSEAPKGIFDPWERLQDEWSNLLIETVKTYFQVS